MNLLQRLQFWGDRHHPLWLDIVRIVLGLFLVFKGIEFFTNMGETVSLLDKHVPFGGFMQILIGHYVAFGHIAGGLMLAIGMLTRVASLVQIPILIGAIIFINSSSGLLKPFSELGLSIVVLLLLILFFIIGSGRWSFDAYLEKDNATQT